MEKWSDKAIINDEAQKRFELQTDKAVAFIVYQMAMPDVLVAQLYNNTKNQAIVNREQVKSVVSL